MLKEAGLVTDRADGTRRIYQIRQQGVQAIHDYLDQMWGRAMAAFQAEAKQTVIGMCRPHRGLTCRTVRGAAVV